MVWAENRQTTIDVDKVHSLLGIFNIYMPLIYNDSKENAMKRLRDEIDKASKGKSLSSITSTYKYQKAINKVGIKREDFSIAFSLADVSEIERFVARQEELAEMHRILNDDGSRRIVVLHDLGGIGKTQLSIAYAKRHKDSYSAIFWFNIKDEDSLRQSFTKAARQMLRDIPRPVD